MKLQYSIPSYQRAVKTFFCALSAHYPSNKILQRNVYISENAPSDLILSNLVINSFSIPNDSTLVLRQKSSINMCSNWLASLDMGTELIVKLLFSDDSVLSEPQLSNFLLLEQDPHCVALVSPVIISFDSGHSDSYRLANKQLKIRASDYISLLLRRPDLVALSPSAYYFKRSDFFHSLNYLLTLAPLKQCTFNGAGIDSLAMMTLFAKSDSYIIYDPSALVQFGASNDSITINDLRSGRNLVQTNRNIAHSFFISTGFEVHYQRFLSFRQKH